MRFKDFWKKYSYVIVRCFVDQIAIAVFALAVAIGVAISSPVLLLASSVFSVLFFMFMIGLMCWKAGVEDKEKIDLGRFKGNSLTGLYIGLLANIPNFVLAVMYALFDGKVGAFANLALKLIYGEYLGILSIQVGENKLGLYPISFFVILIPAILATFVGYLLGVKGIIKPKITKKDLE